MDAAEPPYFIVIGASGIEGLGDIKDLLRALPHPVPAIVMVVLHRPSDKASALREVLAQGSEIPVVVATDTEKLKPGTCYIGEPEAHLTLTSRDKVRLVPGAGNRLRNRTVDTLFNSAARHAGPRRVIGVVLSGALDDGSRGLAAIHHAGGLTMVLDPERKARGMQQNAIDFDGPISFIGTAGEIARMIGRVLAANEHPGRLHEAQ